MAKKSRPQVIIAEETLDRLERLAEAMLARSPDLAGRLLDELSRARILPAAKIAPDVAGIGSTVTWRDEAAGRDQTVTLVWPEEADIAEGRASVLTPVGVALLGLKAGAQFSWETRAGETRDLTVLSVTQPQPAGPAH